MISAFFCDRLRKLDGVKRDPEIQAMLAVRERRVDRMDAVECNPSVMDRNGGLRRDADALDVGPTFLHCQGLRVGETLFRSPPPVALWKLGTNEHTTVFAEAIERGGVGGENRLEVDNVAHAVRSIRSKIRCLCPLPTSAPMVR
jgi:hypothetical protein